jgi:hypothetical protein
MHYENESRGLSEKDGNGKTKGSLGYVARVIC